MRFKQSLGVAFALVVSAVVVFGTATTATALENESKYIIQVPDGQMSQLTKALTDIGETAAKKFYQGPDAATATLSSTDVKKLSLLVPNVTIVQDHPVYLSAVASTDQSSAPWHLASLNDTQTVRSTRYSYPSADGSGVDVYLLDSGVDLTAYDNANKELYGKIGVGKNFYFDGGPWSTSTNTDDCYTADHQSGGHGTHVAGIIASNTYGVAKSATIIPERVFSCPQFNPTNNTVEPVSSLSILYDALDDVMTKQATSHRPAVINMSLGGPVDSLLNSKVQSAIAQGISVVVAAGNGSHDPDTNSGWVSACNSSPASAPNAIIVGATTNNLSLASYSNTGPCVSILAPGSFVTSVAAWGGSVSMSGTSMASPLVAGVAAVYLGLNPSATPSQVKTALQSNSLVDRVSNVPSDTPNRLVNANFMLQPIAIGIPFTPTLAATGITSIKLNWSAVTVTLDGVNGSVSDFSIRYRKRGTSAWTVSPHQPLGDTKSLTLAGLQRSTSYEFQVAGMSASTLGSYSPTLVSTTLSGVPAPVRNFVSTRYTNRVALQWVVPATTNGGGSLTDYNIYFRKLGTSAWTKFSDGRSTRTTATVTNLRRYTNYQFYVRAVTAYGEGSASVILNVRTK